MVFRVIKSIRMRCAVNVARVGKRRGSYRVLVGRHEGSRSLRKPSSRWEDNTKMNLIEIKWGRRLDRWRALVNKVMYVWVP